MSRFQFSLRSLLGFVALVAVGCAALLYPSDLWASLAVYGALVALATAILGSIVRRGSAQYFWLGFALFGCGYMWLTYEGEANVSPPGWFQLEGQQGCTKLLRFAYDKLHAREPSQGLLYNDLRPFTEVGHSLWTLVFAFAGGWIGRYFGAIQGSSSTACSIRKQSDSSVAANGDQPQSPAEPDQPDD
jgi:hypothetical protein